MKYYFPLYLDAGNRGCEAIAVGTALLLGTSEKENEALCTNISLDSSLGLNSIMTLRKANNLSLLQKVMRKIEFMCAGSTIARKNILMKYDYLNFFKRIRKDDIMISTGGDMMCYGNNEVIYTNDYVNKIGAKTILWGCSMGPENLTPEKELTLRKFSLVYARESLSYEFFKSLGLKNVCLFPDPAFVLEPESCTLPNCFFKGSVIGINLSNYVLGGYSLDSTFGIEVKSMIDYIIKNTNLHILLIPHVTWSDQDDRIVARNVMSMYEDIDRISVLDIANLNYCQIRHVIGNCKIFIGARTHAVISAYSMCVPTIALGYSIKSRGIATDLGLEDYLVIDSKKFEKGQLQKALERLIVEIGDVSQYLMNIMSEYKERAYGIRKVMKSI